MKTIAFLNMKGGVGKTTSSLNVATGLAMKGYKTLLIDFDPQSNTTTTFLQEEPEYNISKLIFNTNDVSKAIKTVDTNLSLIPATLELAETEKKLCLNTTIPQHNRLKKIIREVEHEYDYCIIDCPPIINTLTINTLIASDQIIIPVTPEKYAITGFNVTINNIMEIRENFEVDTTFKILFTMVNRNNTEKTVIEQLSAIQGIPTYKTQIRFQAKPVKVASLNNTVMIKNAKANVAQDYLELIEEIIKEGK